MTFPCVTRSGAIHQHEVYVGEGPGGGMIKTVTVWGEMFALLNDGAIWFKPFLSAKAKAQYDRMAKEYARKNGRTPQMDQWDMNEATITIMPTVAGPMAGKWFMLLAPPDK